MSAKGFLIEGEHSPAGDHDPLALARTAAVLRDLLAAVERLQEGGGQADVIPEELTAAAPARAYSLTAREHEVLRLVVTGLSNRLVARRLGIAERTVKVHLHSVYRKLGVSGRAEAIVLMLGGEGRRGAVDGEALAGC